MKIGFIAHVPIPGVVGGSIRSMELAKALALAGEEVHLYGQLEKNLPEIRNIHYHNYPSMGREIPAATKRFLEEFKEYDIIYERFQFLFNNLGFMVSKILRKPYCLEVHGFPIDELKIIWKDERLKNLRKLNSPSMLMARIAPAWFLKWLENKVLERSSLIIVTSEGTKDILIKRGISSKIGVVTNAVDPRKFSPYIKPENLKNNNETIVSFVGDLFNEGVNTIIDVAEILKGENIKFVLVGPGPVDYYKNEIEKRDISNVFFYGPTPHDDVPKILAGSDIVLALYSTGAQRFDEGFHYSPIKIFEYLCMEKPTITIRVKQLEKHFKDREEVLFVESDNPKKLAEKILYLKDNGTVAKQIAKKGRNLTLKEHTWEKRAVQLREHLQDIENK